MLGEMNHLRLPINLIDDGLRLRRTSSHAVHLRQSFPVALFIGMLLPIDSI
jgi:hypothetical protein